MNSIDFQCFTDADLDRIISSMIVEKERRIKELKASQNKAFNSKLKTLIDEIIAAGFIITIGDGFDWSYETILDSNTPNWWIELREDDVENLPPT